MTGGDSAITRLLQSTSPEAGEELLAVVYEDLRSIARARLARERPGHTLQPTALVHEAYLRLGGAEGLDFENRRHFFCAAAEAMRRILMDQARRKGQLRHGGAHGREALDHVELAIEAPGVDLLALEEALEKLEAADPRAREIVNLRFFAGLTVRETADALDISTSTVDREWSFLSTFLLQALENGDR